MSTQLPIIGHAAQPNPDVSPIFAFDREGEVWSSWGIHVRPITWADYVQSRITELERENAELRALLRECRDYVAEARQMLALCHTDPITGEIDQYGAEGVAEDDVLIAKIDASIAKEGWK